MLYQQGTQRIEVVVRKESVDTGAGSKTADEATTGASGGGSGGSSGTTSRSNAFKRTNITHSLAVVKQGAISIGNYLAGGIGYQNGDQALQDNVQRTIEQVEDVSGFASSVAMGATYGAAGGTAGIIIGASLATATWATHHVLKYANREREYDYKVFKENNSVEYMRSRASVNLTTGRLR